MREDEQILGGVDNDISLGHTGFERLLSFQELLGRHLGDSHP